MSRKTKIEYRRFPHGDAAADYMQTMVEWGAKIKILWSSLRPRDISPTGHPERWDLEVIFKIKEPKEDPAISYDPVAGVPGVLGPYRTAWDACVGRRVAERQKP